MCGISSLFSLSELYLQNFGGCQSPQQVHLRYRNYCTRAPAPKALRPGRNAQPQWLSAPSPAPAPRPPSAERVPHTQSVELGIKQDSLEPKPNCTKSGAVAKIPSPGNTPSCV